ncbi:HAMP domain-containing sensor histidine kinase [Butyrivibrio sp. LC3010]|uniref:HAMP domain-containing sensor histidine kinase n=1 Tax=Butyrivibrio sp. LC3010 TaxID=1280680 RepID=UPI00041B932D|nr:HAMP domain-containing sensor histidine kinase [Butyrivibrio sp. LC3010]
MKLFFSSMRREKGTLYSLVTRYYIFFAAAVLLLAFIVVRLTDESLEMANITIDVDKIINNKEALKSEKYDRLSTGGMLGKGSYFEVLDEAAKVIYSSDKSKSNEYSPEVLQFIPDVSGNTYYYLDSVIGDDGKNRGYILNKYMAVTSDEDEQFGLGGIAVFDEDRNVIFQNEGINIKHISDSEYKILFENDEDTYLQKFEFTTGSGDVRTMLIHQDFSSSSANNAYRKIYMTAILSFLFILSIFVVFFVLNTAFAVRKPIKMLQNAMDDFGSGNKDVAITYSGPKEFVQIMDSFNEMAGKLATAEREKEKLEEERQKILADISHDLKTPVTVIQGYARAVADGFVPESEVNKYLETISRKSDNLAELINSFYEYSKLEHPQFRIYKKECDICEYFREYLAIKYSELDLSGYEMEISIPEKVIKKSIDEAQLKRVFENIISNSVKSNPKGTVIYAGMEVLEGKTDIDNKVYRNDNVSKTAGSERGNKNDRMAQNYDDRSPKVVIYLGDNGVGVPAAIRDDVFKPFIVGDDARTSGKGTGLGLAIAKQIIEAHGGTIRLMDENESDYSTMFEIIL